MRRGRSAVTSLVSAEMVTMVGGVAFVTLAARRTGVDGLGIYGIAAGLVSTAGSLLDVRLEEYAGRELQSARPDRLRVWFDVLVADVTFGVARGVVLVALAPLVSWAFGGDVVASFVVLSVALAVQTSEATFAHLFVAHQRAHVVAFARVAAVGGRLVAISTWHQPGATTIAWAATIGAALSIGVLVVGSRTSLEFRPSARRSRQAVASARATVAATSLASTLRGAVSQLDVLVVGAIAGTAAAGSYRLARSVAAVVSTVLAPLRLARFPSIAAAASARRWSVLGQELRRLSIASVAVGAVAVTIWSLAGRAVLDVLLGSDHPFGASHTVGAILLVQMTIEYATSWSKVLPVVLDRGAAAMVDGAWYLVASAVLMPVGAAVADEEGVAVVVALVSLIASLGWARWVHVRLQHGEETSPKGTTAPTNGRHR